MSIRGDNGALALGGEETPGSSCPTFPLPPAASVLLDTSPDPRDSQVDDVVAGVDARGELDEGLLRSLGVPCPRLLVGLGFMDRPTWSTDLLIRRDSSRPGDFVPARQHLQLRTS